MKENETAFKQEVILVLLLSVISLFLNINTVERILLIASLLLILLATTLNSAIEVIVDRIGLDLNELSGVAKDLGSAAVFISFAIAALVWGGILCSNT
jgi:diacylglycerol kinase (ATP)